MFPLSLISRIGTCANRKGKGFGEAVVNLWKLVQHAIDLSFGERCHLSSCVFIGSCCRSCRLPVRIRPWVWARWDCHNCHNPYRIHVCYNDMVTWIPSIYPNIYHQYTPFMLAYIPAPWILWVSAMEKWWKMYIERSRSSSRSNQIYGKSRSKLETGHFFTKAFGASDQKLCWKFCVASAMAARTSILPSVKLT